MSPRLAVLLAWLAAAASAARRATRGGARPRPRVVGGADDVDNMFPFAVTLECDHERWFESRMCSGSLLTASWVLTAAHCLISELARIRYGDFEKLPNETDKFSKVLRSVPYPLYNQIDALLKNDIALLMVSAVPTRTFARLSAVDFLALTGQPAVLAGFSPFLESGEYGRELQTRPLQVLEVMITMCELTEEDNSNDITVSSNGPYICVQSRCSEKGRSHMAPGDSGGPLLHDGRVVGVASLIVYLLSGAYTPVSPYLSWIHEVIAAS